MNTAPYRTDCANLLGTRLAFAQPRYNYQTTSVSTAYPLLSICALRLKRRRTWRELDPGCMCQTVGNSPFSQLTFDRGIDGRVHFLIKGRTAHGKTRTEPGLCLHGRCNQPSPARIMTRSSPSQTMPPPSILHTPSHPYLTYPSARKPGSLPTCASLCSSRRVIDSYLLPGA
jgi:hypothetical protein